MSTAGLSITVRAVIAEVPTQYSASFVAGQLRSIAEIREVGERRAGGTYEFYGARLTRYSGEQLHGAAPVELQFDLQGTLMSQASLGNNQIEQIKSRSQLLRSHALAQQAARAH